MKFDKFAALGLFLVGASLATAIGAHADTTVALGNWGSTPQSSQPTNVYVEATRTLMTFGCSSVTIEGALTLDGAQKFETTGVERSHLGSPTSPGTPVKVTGEVNGNLMYLKVIQNVPAENGGTQPYESDYIVELGNHANFPTCG